ncbi:hypothetical protein IT409_01335 [Candidatus Falkowbacteria bacterium]|nr:hypothetical protein [Candidatus Falkowbacteria bacterium]
MNIPFKKTFTTNSEVLLRRAGYARQEDKRMQKISYFRSLTTQHFPKFHIYVENEAPLELSLHLDQKPHSYDGQRAHVGEYDGNTVRAEALRVYNLILGQESEVRSQESEKKEKEESDEKEGWLSRWFS